MRRIILCTIAALLACGTVYSRPADYFLPGTYSSGSIANMPYRFFVPYDYREGVHYPLVLTLHGGGGTGSDNWLHITYEANVSEAWATVAHQAEYPCFVLSPQNHTATGDWRNLITCILHLIEELRADGYRIDPNRIYVCGISWGGRGTFHALNSTYARDWSFAGGIPMCGSSTASFMANIPNDMPIWNCHSQDDNVVGVSSSRSMVSAFASRGVTFAYTHCTGNGQCADALTDAELDALVASGKNHIYTEFCCYGHAINEEVLAIPQVYDWIFSKTNDAVPPADPTGLTGTGSNSRSISFSWQPPVAAADGDTATGYLVYRNGELVGSSAHTYFTDSTVTENTAYEYAVHSLDYSLQSMGAATGRLSSAADTDAPGVSGTLVYGLTELEVMFDEDMDSTSASDPGNYLFTGGITAAGATLLADRRTVVLATTEQVAGTAYTITLNGITDAATARNQIPAGTAIPFTAAARFADDFEQGGYSAWTPAVSDLWTIGEVDGNHTLHLSGYGAPPLIVERYYRTVTVDLDVRGNGNNDVFRNFALIFGYQDPDNYYFLNVCGSSAFTVNGFFRVTDGNRDKLVDGPVGVWNDDDRWHHVRMDHDVLTGNISLYWDTRENLIMQVNDRTFQGGFIGLWSLMNKRVHFDNVEITRVRDDGFPVSGVHGGTGGNKGLPAFSIVNPVRGTVTFPVPSGSGFVKVFNGAGRPVAAVAGTWDMKDSAGDYVPAGIYLYTVTVPGGTVTGRFMVVE